MAEASGSRTHRRRRKTATAGFEDHEAHRNPCASVLVPYNLHRSHVYTPPPTMRVLGIDAGTGGTRAVIVDENGRILAFATDAAVRKVLAGCAEIRLTASG